MATLALWPQPLATGPAHSGLTVELARPLVATLLHRTCPTRRVPRTVTAHVPQSHLRQPGQTATFRTTRGASGARKVVPKEAVRTKQQRI